MSDRASFSNTFVTYRAFLLMVITMITVGGTLFSFVLRMHASAPHVKSARQESVTAIENRLDRIESRVHGRLRRIETKVDKLLAR